MINMRKHNRVNFSISDGIVGRFILKNSNLDLQTAYILNLSEGGLYFTLRNDQNALVDEGDNLRFVEIKKWATKQFLVNIEANVVWTGKLSEQNCFGVGCKFRSVSEKNLKNLRDLISERFQEQNSVN